MPRAHAGARPALRHVPRAHRRVPGEPAGSGLGRRLHRQEQIDGLLALLAEEYAADGVARGQRGVGLDRELPAGLARRIALAGEERALGAAGEAVPPGHGEGAAVVAAIAAGDRAAHVEAIEVADRERPLLAGEVEGVGEAAAGDVFRAAVDDGADRMAAVSGDA